jgi:glycosyltransferase involved in cell wall biosynthesis
MLQIRCGDYRLHVMVAVSERQDPSVTIAACPSAAESTPDPRATAIATIAIVIAAYNAERFLASALESVIAQTDTDWQCVVVDDGSTDGTHTVAATFAAADQRFHVVRRAVNGGPAAARNSGLAEIGADAEWVAFLDADDVWMPDALAILRAALLADPAAVGAHGLYRHIDHAGNCLGDGIDPRQRERHAIQNGRVVAVPPAAPTTFAVLVLDAVIEPMATALLSRAALNAIGWFDAEFRYCEDADLFLRLSTIAHIVFVDRVIVGYRRHADNLTQDTPLTRRELRSFNHRLRRKVQGLSGLNADQRELVRVAAYVAYRWRLNRWLSAGRHEARRGNMRGAAWCWAHVPTNLFRWSWHRALAAIAH